MGKLVKEGVNWRKAADKARTRLRDAMSDDLPMSYLLALTEAYAAAEVHRVIANRKRCQKMALALLAGKENRG